jgi:photosystem II stability/assembly factor-like uncharacterized protein
MRRSWVRRLIVLLVAAATVAGTAVEAAGSAAAAGHGGAEVAANNISLLRGSQAQVAQARQQTANVPVGDAAAWKFVGPTNIGGRITDIAVDPTTTPSTVYAAVASGGIMKSTDGGVTWTPAWPTSNVQVMGALARGSDGTLWAGTGEANSSGGGDQFLTDAAPMGNGLYKSTDGGQSWQLSGLPNSGAFGRIAVNPDNPNEVWAAASGWLNVTSSQRGLYHTTDGGKTWVGSLAPPNSTTGAIDVAVDPANPNIILASLSDKFRTDGAFHYGGIGSGLYRSTNDGQTWTRLDNSNFTGPVCSWDASQSGLNVSPDLGRIAIAFAPSNPNRVYIQSSGFNGPDKGFYVSNDAGQTWTCGGAEPGSPTAGYEWYFGRLWVDPVDENHVFAADINLMDSTDGGNTWTSSRGQHADQHAMAWDPNVPNKVYLGDDGGMYVSIQNGATGTWTHAQVEPWNQAYHISVSQQDPSRIVAGLQDQGSIRSWTPGTEPTDLTQWNSFGGGDGHWVQINPDNQLVYYECSQGAPPRVSCARFVDSAAAGPGVTTTRTTLSSPDWPSNTRVTTDSPLVLDPADPNYVYVAGTSIARSGDGVVSGTGAWTIISPDTPDSPQSLPGIVPANEINSDQTYANEYGTVTEIAPAKSTGTPTTPSSTIYAGTDTGKVWKTTNATASDPSDVQWTQLGAGVLPQRWVTTMVVDPANANHVYVGFANYKDGNRPQKDNVWETTDGGATWHNISANLPNSPVQMLTYNQSRHQLYAATDFGAFYLANGNKSWTRLGTGLPNAAVMDLKLTGDGETIYAATFGRGIYQIPTPRG